MKSEMDSLKKVNFVASVFLSLGWCWLNSVGITVLYLQYYWVLNIFG
jgi:hypothetical protein